MNNDLIKSVFSDDPEILRALEAKEQTKLLRDIANRKAIIGNIELIKGDKGDKGEPGETIVGPVGPMGPDGKDGINGKDGKSIEGPKGKDGKDGRDGKDGKDGSSTTAKAVLEAIKDLSGEESTKFFKAIGSKIDISYIKNAQSFMYKGARYKLEDLMHGGGSSSSSSSGYQVPTGTVNGVNTIFIFATAPNSIVVDGISMRQTSTDGTVNWTGTTTITLSVAPNFDIYGVS